MTTEQTQPEQQTPQTEQQTQQTESDKEVSGQKTRKSIMKKINSSDNDTDCEQTIAQQTEKQTELGSVDDFSEPCKKADEVVDEIGISGMDEICDIVCDTMKDILKKIPEKLTEVSEDEYLNHNSRNPNDFEKFIKSTNLLKNRKKDRTITEMKKDPKYHNNLNSIKGLEHYDEEMKEEETKEIKKNIRDVQKSISSIKTDVGILYALFIVFSAFMMFFH